ncbi:MAG: signal peptidase II [Rhizobiaceae bacterium]|nr:signal peptidase II [Rhizobiaceae bacterium]
MKLRGFVPLATLAALCVIVDQWVKMLVETRLVMHEQVDLVPFFALFRTYNTGVAFSMFSSIGDKGLIAISLAVIAFMLYLATRTSSQFALAGFALVIGGAVGNLIDRVVHGHVIDYFLFHTPVWSFAVFNLADAFITVGAAMILLYELFGARAAGQ